MAKGGPVDGIMPPEVPGVLPPFPISLARGWYGEMLENTKHVRVYMVKRVAFGYGELGRGEETCGGRLV